MVPWNMLPKDLQKAILAMVLYGGTLACSGPMVCDPAPPPSMIAPTAPTRTPMICDPLHRRPSRHRQPAPGRR